MGIILLEPKKNSLLQGRESYVRVKRASMVIHEEQVILQIRFIDALIRLHL